MIAAVNPLKEVIKLIPGYDPYTTAGDCRFDAESAQTALDFFSECLRHVEGALAGSPLALEPWQQAIIANLFGWKRPDGTRRFREALIIVPRKNGKTTIVAGLVLFMLFCDKEPGAQVYSAAADRDQANLVFRIAKAMVLGESELAERCEIYHNSIVIEETNSSYKAISAEASTKHGYNTHCVVIDELHAQPNRDLVDVLMTSTGARRQPLVVHITTADFDRESICNEKYTYACNVRDGKFPDPAFLPVVYEALPEDDWTSPEVWAKANPNLGVSVSKDYLARECQRAKETPSYENTFKRLHLDIRTQQDVRWLSLESWDACGQDFDFDALLDRKVFGALDLASKEDITALVWLGLPRHDGDQWIVFPRFWVPQEGAELRERRDRVPYVTWGREKHITLTPGSRTSYRMVQQQFIEDVKRLKLGKESVGADQWNLELFRQEIDPDSQYIVEYGQNMRNLSAPTKELSSLVTSRMVRHNRNPVLRWMAGNVAIHEDSNENQRPVKSKGTERIDGIVACVMAIGMAMNAEQPKANTYSFRGILTY